MKKLVHALVLTGLVGVPTFAMAEEPASPHTLSGNITLTSDYVFRGVSQTQGGPAIQGGFDYAHASGFYVGTWASNVAWVKEGGFKDDSSMEIDLYGGYRGTAGDFGYDVGVIGYFYPGDKVAGMPSPNTTEVYLGASWKFLSAKYSHVVSKNFIGWVNPVTLEESKNSGYIELNANYDLGGGWGVLGHVGMQKVKDYETATGGDADYTDWKIGVSKDIGFGVVSLAYTDTNADEVCCYTIAGEEVADGRVFVSFSKTF
ncbi:MAG: TorF family putative porin [Thiobacillus sp.]|nr:TorF family putative porin [Thiobacillus sp.]